MKGVDSIEKYGLDLARHFLYNIDPVLGARIEIEEFAWERALIDGTEHDHTWLRRGQEIRTAALGRPHDHNYWSGFRPDLIAKLSS